MDRTYIESPIVSPHFQRYQNWKHVNPSQCIRERKFKQSFIHLTKMVVVKMIDWARLSFKKETLLFFCLSFLCLFFFFLTFDFPIICHFS